MPLHLTSAFALISIFLMLSATAHGQPSANLLSNGALDGREKSEPPPMWEPLVIGVPAEFATDVSEKHGGSSSVRITAGETTRSYARSQPIPVAPGETIHGSAWVKVRDVPAGKGTVIMIAEFSDGAGGNESVEKFNTANIAEASKGWTKIQGSVKVPAQAAELRIRIGFSYSMGTCWWDDVVITADEPLAIRMDLKQPRLSPAMKTIPAVILNRNRSRGECRIDVSLNDKKNATVVKLTGEAVQRVDVPANVSMRGKVTAKLALSRQNKVLFTDERQLNVPPAIVLSVPSPTHWVLEDGKPHLEGYIDLAMSDETREGATIDMRISGTPFWTTKSDQPLADGITRFDFDAREVGRGKHAIVVQVKSRNGKVIASAERPWHVIERRQAKVVINSAGYPEYDGKAIFPIGIFNGGKFEEQGKAGFTVTHAYNAARIFDVERPEDDNVLKWLDSSAEHGMKMMLMVPMRLAIKQDWDSIRRRVRVFRNHPGLLCWDEEEGFARGDFKPDTLKKLRQIITEEDPHHPFMVGDSRGAIGRMGDRKTFFPVEEMDMGMWWWYPFPMKEQPGEALEGDEGTSGSELVLPTFLTHANTTKPIWVGIQSYKKGALPDGRYPTPTEYRAQAYLAIIHGAKGIMYYGGSVTGGLFLNPQEGRWDELQKVVRELNEHSPFFMSPSLETPRISNPSISACIKEANGKTILIAANRSIKPIEATFESPLIKSGKLHRKFGPLEVQIHELK